MNIIPGGKMQTTSTKAIILFLIAAILGALGQYLYKTGVENSSGNILSWFKNYRVISGILCYITIMFLFVISFKIGGELTVLYPVYATTFIWGALIAVTLLGENLTLYKIGGIIFIIIGVLLTVK